MVHFAVAITCIVDSTLYRYGSGRDTGTSVLLHNPCNERMLSFHTTLGAFGISHSRLMQLNLSRKNEHSPELARMGLIYRQVELLT